MSSHTANQTWLVETGDRVIQKKAKAGVASLSDWERLVYCLWVADYMMRNAGDFANAEDMYPTFRTDAAEAAARLGLAATRDTFSLSERKLRNEYFGRFERVVDEIKNAEPNAA
jgi:hypothetical protein